MRAGGAILGAMLALAVPARAADDSFLSPALRFFTGGEATPPALSRAITAYEEGRSFAALEGAREALDDGSEGPFADEARLLRALALAGLGWNDLAIPAFEAVLAADPPSPYYPLALLGLLESHEREARPEAVVSAWERWLDVPWREDSARGRRVRALVEAYGEVRRGGERLGRDERDLLESPSRLAELRAASRERVTDRLLYRSGLALYRLGRHRESVETLRRIALPSPYHPYALYTSAQALHAGGEGEKAVATVRRLLSSPPAGPEAEALAGRAAILHAQLLFESGRVEESLRAAGAVPGEGFHAAQARLLRGDICLETERPGLAVTYYRELADAPLAPRLEAGRGLGLGAAYAALGDFTAASSALRAAAERVSRARGEEAAGGPGAARLETLALADARRLADAASAERARLAAGIRRIAALEGPMSLGRLFRTIFMSHRNTVLGAPVHDIEALASGGRIRRAEALSSEPLWLEYLRSAERVDVERALARRIALESAGPEEARLLAADVRKPLPGRDAWRRSVAAGEPPADAASREEGIHASMATAREAIARFLHGRGEGLRRLEFDLEAALSHALARRTAAGGG